MFVNSSQDTEDHLWYKVPINNLFDAQIVQAITDSSGGGEGNCAALVPPCLQKRCRSAILDAPFTNGA